MKKIITAERIADIVWNSFSKVCGYFMIREFRLHLIYVLYGFHKKYQVADEGKLHFQYKAEGDQLLNDLYSCILNRRLPDLKLKRVYDELSEIPYEEFEEAYLNTLIDLNDRLSRTSGKSSDDYFTPFTITTLIAYFVNKENCKSVYDPFCGAAAIVNKLDSGICFSGQDIDLETSLIARVNMEARYGCDKGITCHDSLSEWYDKHFDALVSCPPFGLSISNIPIAVKDNIYKETGFHAGHDIEELLISESCTNHAKICVLLLRTSFSFSDATFKLRKFLIDNNYIDKIVRLPSNLLYNTSIPTLLLVCKFDRKSIDPIKFVFTENYVVNKGGNKRVELDVGRFIEMLESDNQNDCINVEADVICEYNYNLTPSLYKKDRLKVYDGQRIVKLCDVLGLMRPSKEDDGNSKVLSLHNFSNKYIDIVLAENNLEEDSQNKNSYKTFHCNENECCLLVVKGMASENLKYALYTSGGTFRCDNRVRAFRINTEFVSPDYLAYLLTVRPTFSGVDITTVMMVPFVIDSKDKQRKIIEKLKREYINQREAEFEAENRRLGLKKPISDIEHMLGTTMHRIDSSIARIERSKPDDPVYQIAVKKLIDNIRYTMRVIKFTNSKIDKQNFRMEYGDICAFVKEYEDNWKNYGDKYFQLNVNIEMEDCPDVSFDRTMLTVMLDSIMDNASRHGFHKKASENNKVCINLSLTMFDNKYYLLIRVCNNGEPIKKGFTIEDYISRGLYTEETGRSGLGGSHVYDIVKGHGGYLCLDSNQIWNVIVEILFPINNLNRNNNAIILYENAGKCI